MWDPEKQVSFWWAFTVHGLSLAFICLKFLDHKDTGSPASFQSIDRLCMRVCLLIHTLCTLVIVLMTRCASSKLAPGSASSGLWESCPGVFPCSIFLFVCVIPAAHSLPVDVLEQACSPAVRRVWHGRDIRSRCRDVEGTGFQAEHAKC